MNDSMMSVRAAAEHPAKGRPGGYREILRVAYPLMISMGSITLMQFVDRMFLSWHSTVSIQAALPAGILSFTFICGFMALAGYTSTLVAQFSGAADPRSCSSATAQGAIIALLSWPLLCAMIPAGRWLLIQSGHPPEILAEELIYFDILMVGSVGSPLGAALSGFYSGRGRTVIVMKATIAANLVNLVLDYAWIFGHWGFPEMGIRGAAWGSVVSGLVLPGLLLIKYFSPRAHRRYGTRRTFRWDRMMARRLIRFGLPSGIHLALDVASFAVFVLLTGRMGAAALAASNIALSINMLTFLPMIGISMAASIVVGQYQGRHASGYAERAAWNALKMGLCYMGSVGLLFIFFPVFFLSFFTVTESGLSLEDLLPTGRWLMIIMALWGIPDAVNLVLSGALKGAGDTRFVMWFSLLLAWGVLVPGQWVIVFVLEVGVVAAWCWTAFYILLLGSGFLIRFRSGRWRDIDVIGSISPVLPDRPGAEALVAGE